MVGTVGHPPGTGLELTLQPPPPPHALTRTARDPQSLSLVPTCQPGQILEGKEAGLGPGRLLNDPPGA